MQRRWYNPSLGGFEGRNSPEGDEEALRVLDESYESGPCIEVCWKWHNLGATVKASLFRAGETAKVADDAKQGEEAG